MIDRITAPVVDGEVEMFIAMRNRKIYLLRFLLFFIPLLGGERAVTKRLWERVPDRYKDRFKIEAGLNFYALHYLRGLRYEVFPGVTQTAKERKFGVREGVRRRLRMSAEVLEAVWELERREVPGETRDRRLAAFNVLAGLFGLLIGVVVLLAAYTGPVSFFSSLFAEELVEDPRAPLVTLVLLVASGVGLPVLVAAGAALALGNAVFILSNLLRLASSGQRRQR